MPIDSICKMQVDDKTPFKSVYKNREYYFCSRNCEKKFNELDKSVIRVRRSLKDKERISFGKLKREIIDPGICTLCGACVASCEVLTIREEKPALQGKCTACGVCYKQCPRTITTESSLIGNVLDVFTARTMLPGIKGQDGGGCNFNASLCARRRFNRQCSCDREKRGGTLETIVNNGANQ